MDKDVFKRSDLRQLCSFMLYREQTTDEIQALSYEKQMDKAKNLAYNILESVSKGEMDSDTAREELTEAFDTYKEVCTEMGTKLGARILSQLLHTNEKD